jgi:hypothetical protein
LLPHNDSAGKEMMKRRGRRTIDHALQSSFEFEEQILFCFVLILTVYVSSSQCFCWKGDDQKGEGGKKEWIEL